MSGFFVRLQQILEKTFVFMNWSTLCGSIPIILLIAVSTPLWVSLPTFSSWMGSSVPIWQGSDWELQKCWISSNFWRFWFWPIWDCYFHRNSRISVFYCAWSPITLRLFAECWRIWSIWDEKSKLASIGLSSKNYNLEAQSNYLFLYNNNFNSNAP